MLVGKESQNSGLYLITASPETCSTSPAICAVRNNHDRNEEGKVKAQNLNRPLTHYIGRRRCCCSYLQPDTAMCYAACYAFLQQSPDTCCLKHHACAVRRKIVASTLSQSSSPSCRTCCYPLSPAAAVFSTPIVRGETGGRDRRRAERT